MQIWISVYPAIQVSSSNPFFSNDLEGLIKIIILLGTVVGAVWVMLKGKLQQDINGVGERTKNLENTTVAHDTALDELKERVMRVENTASNLAVTVGEVRRSQEAVTDQMREMQVNIIGEIQRTREVMRQDNSAMRERVVRLETVNEIEQKLGRKISELSRDD